MDLGLTDKVAIVTGGSKGIGEAITRLLISEGAHVANVNRSTEEGLALEAEYAQQDKRCKFIQADLSETENCKRAVDEALTEFGRIDIVINNAGVNDSKGVDSDISEFVGSLHKNLIHYYAMVHFSLEQLKANRGSIVNVGSKVAITGQGGTSGYAAAKGGINALTREWAVDLAEYGIRANAVLPAETWTPLYDRILGEMDDPAGEKKKIADLIPLERRFTTSQEIADTVVFVASPRSSHTTGQILLVDGGYTHLDRKYTSG